MSVYEPNPAVRPVGAEPDELIDADPVPAHPSDEPGIDAGNLPGDNRPPASARPLRDRADG